MEECVDFTEEKKLKEKNTRKNTKIHEKLKKKNYPLDNPNHFKTDEKLLLRLHCVRF